MKIKYKPWAKGLMYLVEAVVIILSVFPILWVIMSSFKTNGEILSLTAGAARPLLAGYLH